MWFCTFLILGFVLLLIDTGIEPWDASPWPILPIHQGMRWNDSMCCNKLDYVLYYYYFWVGFSCLTRLIGYQVSWANSRPMFMVMPTTCNNSRKTFSYGLVRFIVIKSMLFMTLKQFFCWSCRILFLPTTKLTCFYGYADFLIQMII